MTKQDTYLHLLPQIKALTEGETDVIANMANIVAALHEAFGFWWTGFYRVEGKELVLGPFQGPIACTRIPYGRGVCGTAWAQDKTVIVPDVHLFPGHIACDSASNAEIVIPIHKNGKLVGVLDIDSPLKNRFTEADEAGLKKIVAALEEIAEFKD